MSFVASRNSEMPAPPARCSAWPVLAGLTALLLLTAVFACSVGSVMLTPRELVQGLASMSSGTEMGAAANLPATLLHLRLTRVLTAMTTGASLALAGVMMQALLRNPLADPYVLGVSGGAAVGALIALMFAAAAWVVDAAAFAGALAVAMLLYALVQRDLRNAVAERGTPLLLLTGVIIASACGALVTLIVSLAPEGSLRGMVFWLIGDLSGAQWRWLPLLILAACLAFALPLARSLNVLILYADTATALGVRVDFVRQALFFCGALLTASAVSVAGSIAFVGLIVPHACRFALGSDHRLLLPAAPLAGAIVLALADTLARWVLAPQQLPVGVITVLIGAPVFLLQLHHVGRR